MSDPQAGRSVLITGASRGIGRAIALRFAGAGDRVAIHHRDSAELAAKLAAELPGSGHLVVRADLADPEAVRAMTDTAAERLGGLDVLVNNAGVFTAHPITEVSYAEWQRHWQTTLSVNLPSVALPEQPGMSRVVHVHVNTPGVLAQVNSILAEHKVNVEGQLLNTRGEYGYLLTDVAAGYDSALLDKLRAMDQTVRLRVLS